MHKFKFGAIPAIIIAALSSSAFAQTHEHTPQCGHDNLSSPALNALSDIRFKKAVTSKAAPFTDGAVRTMSANVSSENIIDVIVYVHPTYVEDLATPFRFDENDKPIENGAQFMYDRVQTQYDKVNAAFAINNVNARYRVAYIHLLDIERAELGNTDALYDEFFEINLCATENFEENNPKCQTQVYETATALFNQTGADTFHYLRTITDSGSNIAGLGNFFGGTAHFDDYVIRIPDFINSQADEANIDLYLAQYGYITIHEVGHVLGANHPDEDTDGKGHQAHRCGESFPGATTRKRTVMGAGDVQLFFSDPDVFLNGEPCGIAGVADNSDAVRTNAPLLTAVGEKAVISTNFEFAESEFTVDSGSGKHTLRLQRLGDLSHPVSVALMAVDSSAWEQRDFNFGWQEVAFAAGEAYGDVTFTALEREGKFEHTQFSVKMMYSSAGTVTEELVQVNIQSTSLPVIGSVTLDPAAYSVVENAGTVTLTINRTGGTDGEAQLTVKSRNQTALSGTDFTALDSVVTFADGQAAATVTVNITNNSTFQGSRTFAVDIAPVTAGLLTGNTTAVVTITDDETAPPVSGGGGNGGGDSGSESSGGSFGFLTTLFGLLVLTRRKFTNQFHNERK
ncbi:hypothetical protein VT06_16115 [Arsukibacterium sp. MJ3]|uniref:Calx-beta domain-containing protein n=1 Tax=Arsukibacterium sp. MJ3 TaxID=1632859 RepID=UPI00062729C8|nr:Calx-beta domain-containing protein [Arsukibacterium sp. MJ3]KKO47611.1 hypothetical protein VT06_16115 [Arsukibacterium sp. MJ3]